MTSPSATGKSPKDILNRALAFAVAQHQQGNVIQAEQTYRQILHAVPGQIDAQFHLAMALAQTGRREEGVHQYRMLLKLKPDHADAWNNLGNLLQVMNQPEEAGRAFDKARALRPEQPEFHYNYGNLLMSRQGYDKAEEAYRKATALKAEYPQAWNNLGLAVQEQGRLEEAEGIFRSILKRAENLPQTWNNLGVVLFQQNREREAGAAFRRALHYDPKLAAAWRQLTACHRFTSVNEEDARHVRALLDMSGLPDADAAHLHYALGKIHDDCGECDAAFNHFQKANMLQKNTVLFDAAQHRNYVNRIIATFTPEFFKERKEWGNADAHPLFIVGMPRTGKTLMERIMAVHPAVACGGEKLLIRRIAEAITLNGGKNCYPEATLHAESDAIDAFADGYVQQQWQGGAIPACYVTDTLPYNFLHLGLIALLFPEARIMHCIRAPLDTCLLNYFHYFSRGSGHACDLDDLASYYLDYARLMAHWKRVLPVPLCEIIYEDLVAEPHREVARALAFLSLDADVSCLNAGKALHDEEAGKWRRYALHIVPLRARLAATE